MIELFKNKLGMLCTIKDGKEIPLELRPCFPWSRPSNYFVLCDSQGVEFDTVNMGDEMSPATKVLLEEGLQLAGLIFKVTSILDIIEDIELRHYKVDTSSGKRIFQTTLDEWPKKLGGGRLLLTDLHGDSYQIEDWEELDHSSRKILAPYVA